jgi:ketosteroid isomerase-like protein
LQLSAISPVRSQSAIVMAIWLLMPVCQLAYAAKPNESDDRAAIEAFTRKFLRAFEDLDMQHFISCFADNATVFFPIPEPPERVDGKPAIQQRFEHVFASIRSTAKSGPPFHHLMPENVAIQIMPGQTAVVSFQLRNPERISRRTLVLINTNGRWLILHLHASNTPIASEFGR